jgi:chemotaxis protein CheC
LTEKTNHILNAGQLDALAALLQPGSHHASDMLARWIGKPSVVDIQSLENLPLDEAAELLGADGQPMCFCITEITGVITGELMLAFDDASGMALVDILLDQALGTTQEWTEMAISAVNETTNILCCAYLNALSRSVGSEDESAALLPTPPKFVRDFAPSLLQFALMGQAISSDEIIVARTSFEIDGTPANWTLLLVPDGPSMTRLAKMLCNSAPAKKDAD